jgi:hypothetical protein
MISTSICMVIGLVDLFLQDTLQIDSTPEPWTHPPIIGRRLDLKKRTSDLIASSKVFDKSSIRPEHNTNMVELDHREQWIGQPRRSEMNRGKH